MKQPVLIGQTDYTVLVKMRTEAGAPAPALAHTDIDIAYARVEDDNDVTTTDVAPADLASLTAAHTDWGWEVVSATDHPGLYRLDIADAVFASGAWSAVVTISGSGLDPTDCEFVLVNFDPKATTLPANSITATSIASDAITSAKIATGAIDADAIADNAIDAGALAADCITAAKIATGAIDADAIADNAIDAGALAADCITAAKLAADVTTELQSGLATAAALDAVDNFVDTEITDIQNRLPAALVGGRIDASVGAMAANTITASALAADAVDEIWAKTMTELAAVPGVTGTALQALSWCFTLARNKITQTATTQLVRNDADSATIGTSAVSDDGVTFTRGEFA